MATAPVYTDSDGQYTAAALIDLVIADSTQTKIIGDVSSVSVSLLNTNPGSPDYAQDEDYSTLAGKFPVITSAMPIKALSDSELPVGEGGGGGPTTTQIWKTG